MSTHATPLRLNSTDLTTLKGRQKIVALTAYSTPIARLIDSLVDHEDHNHIEFSTSI
ncbi:hypothetical protein [Pseudomonas maumuensis]|uniref:hypothetical protein n=1 Tax=Pseudomonas maumuensis TaxID=2842354 RepID=UPI001CEC04F6|nr:hypothetical protein [Pseudomonas maumuensis]